MFGRRLDYFRLTDTTKQHLDGLVASAGLDKDYVRPIFAITDTADGHLLHVTVNQQDENGKPHIADWASYELASRPVVMPLAAADAAILMRDLEAAQV